MLAMWCSTVRTLRTSVLAISMLLFHRDEVGILEWQWQRAGFARARRHAEPHHGAAMHTTVSGTLTFADTHQPASGISLVLGGSYGPTVTDAQGHFTFTRRAKPRSCDC